jgi:hypothetical protein
LGTAGFNNDAATEVPVGLGELVVIHRRQVAGMLLERPM